MHSLLCGIGGHSSFRFCSLETFRAARDSYPGLRVGDTFFLAYSLKSLIGVEYGHLFIRNRRVEMFSFSAGTRNVGVAENLFELPATGTCSGEVSSTSHKSMAWLANCFFRVGRRCAPVLRCSGGDCYPVAIFGICLFEVFAGSYGSFLDMIAFVHILVHFQSELASRGGHKLP